MNSESANPRPDRAPLRVGLIGCGGIVERTHLPCLQRLAPEVVVSAVADPAEPRRRGIAARLGLPARAVFADHRPLLSSGLVDLVLIATPHHLHAPVLHDAIEREVAFVCEKPLVPDLNSARPLIDRLTSSRLPCTVVHNFLHAPGTTRALARLSTQPAPRPHLGRAFSSISKPVPMDPLDWRSRADAGGGALNDTCYHELYLLEAMMGSPVSSVSAHVRTLFHPISADDFVSLTLLHANGALSTVQTCWAAAAAVPIFCEVHHAEGLIRVEGRGRKLLYHSATSRDWVEECLDDVSIPWMASGHAAFWTATVDALRTARPLPVPPAAAFHQLAILDAARRSSLQGGAWTPLAD